MTRHIDGMPELPEVEVLVRHLAPLVRGRTIRDVDVRREKVTRPTGARKLAAALTGARFGEVTRRGKYMLFTLQRGKERSQLLGHLGMTGRMFLQPARDPLPKHAAVVLSLGRENFIFEDTRYFGRFTLDLSSVGQLGPEPFAKEFSPEYFGQELKRSGQAVKVKLLDQSLVAGVGNIYASEALHRAGVSPRKPSRRLSENEVERLHRTIREVLKEAIRFGSTVPLDWQGGKSGDGLFYYGTAPDASRYYTERLRVYDRSGLPCGICGTAIRRIVQAARSTFFCPTCQPK